MPNWIMANWKMNGSSAMLNAFVSAVRESGVQHSSAWILFPPFVYLGEAREMLAGSGMMLGAQDVSQHVSGAYTGEVSAGMLKEAGCDYVLVGHSERRQYHGEDDVCAARKLTRILEYDMIPVLCIGEHLEEREQGQMENVLKRQLDTVVHVVGKEAASRMIIAYEPIWAIGTGRTATPVQVHEAHQWIVSHMNTLLEGEKVKGVVYGGSVKPENAGALLSIEHVSGALIGGASLKAGDYLSIARAGESSKKR